MDIADLFHLQASLKADRIVDAAADKEDILCIRILARKPLDTLLVVQCLLDLLREPSQLRDQLSVPLFADQSFRERSLDRQQVYRDELCAVRLSRGNRDFRSRVSIEDVIALTGNAGAHYIDNAEHRHSFFLRKPQGCQAVRRLPGLGYHDHHGVLHEFWVPVAEF